MAKKAFLLRISPELWEELNRWAADELRSVNGQIEFLLRQAVQQRKRPARSREEDWELGRDGKDKPE